MAKINLCTIALVELLHFSGWVTFPVTTVVVLVTSARSPRGLATNRGKVIRYMEIYVRKVMPWYEDTSNKVVGSNPITSKLVQ